MGATTNDSQQPSSLSPAAARGAKWSLALLLSINLFNYIDRYILAAVEPEIRKHFFESDASGATERERLMWSMTKTGSLATAFLVSYMIAAPLFGWIADRVSRWLLVGISVGIWSLASGASGLAGTFGLLLLTRCFVGIGEAGYGPSAPAMIADLYPVEKRGAKLAWFYMAIPVGSALGYVLGGAIASSLGWRWPFFAVVIPGLILAGIAFCFKDPRQLAGKKAAGRKKASLKDYLAVLRIPSYVLDTAGMTAMTFAIGGFSYWMPAYLVDEAKAGALDRVNLIFGGMTALTGVGATLTGGWLGDRLQKKMAGAYFIVSASGILISSLFIALMLNSSFVHGLGWVWLFFALFFLFLNTGPSNAILANVTSSSVRANAFALNILLIHALGDAISPPLLGAIIGRFSWGMALYLVCAVMVLASVLWFWGARYLAGDMKKAQAVEDAGSAA